MSFWKLWGLDYLCGLYREVFANILDPFPVLKRKEARTFGEYISKRKCLEEYDKIRTILNDEWGRILKLPENAIITREKITDYLLKWQPDNDKSKFLEGAGYSSGNWERLLEDIRTQILPVEAELMRKTAYGDLFRIRGKLLGPNGVSIRVITIWMTEDASRQTKFITLFPDKEG